ncbi:MAG: ERF family protein [Taibaiella sp.]|nr:ERF family protein [Taibaiella sp.]
MNLWQKLAAISKEIGHIEKTGKNSHFNYNFIEHSNVVATCREIMFEYGVEVDLEVLDGQFLDSGGKTTRTALNMRYYVTNADKPDENFNRLWFSEAMDQQDKGVNKALTAAEKNIFMKLYHISDVDLEADENDIQSPSKKPVQSQPRPAQAPAPSRPAQAPAPAQVAPRPVTQAQPIPAPVGNAICPAHGSNLIKFKMVTGSNGIATRMQCCLSPGCEYRVAV